MRLGQLENTDMQVAQFMEIVQRQRDLLLFTPSHQYGHL